MSGTAGNTPMVQERGKSCVFQKQNYSSHKGDIGSMVLALDNLDSMSRTTLFVKRQNGVQL